MVGVAPGPRQGGQKLKPDCVAILLGKSQTDLQLVLLRYIPLVNLASERTLQSYE